jgi:hypothetical protein
MRCILRVLQVGWSVCAYVRACVDAGVCARGNGEAGLASAKERNGMVTPVQVGTPMTAGCIR